MTQLILGPVIGGLTHKRVNLWGRADGAATLFAWLGSQPDLSDARLAGASLPLSPVDGYAGVAPVSGLRPDTRYYYCLSLSPTPPDPSGGPYPCFTSFPLPGQPRSFTFAFGSCFRPKDQEGGRIFISLEEQRIIDDLRFLIMLGDQIYADDYRYNGLGFVARELEDYRRVYQHVWSTPPLRHLLENLPAFMTLDDHEVDDDWTWKDTSRSAAQIPIWDRLERWLKRRAPFEWQISRQQVLDALQAYWEHQGMHAPQFEQAPGRIETGQYDLDQHEAGSFAYTFTFGAAAFFVLDTRSMRTKNRQERVMLGEQQWACLESWLLGVKDQFPAKFLVSSSALLFRMYTDFPRDRWSGFPQERDRLLHFLAAHGIEGVYLLTGDLHSAHAVRADLYGPGRVPLPVVEFCSSPFEQDTNWFARRSYWPLEHGLVRDQQLAFVIDKPNFGVVRVDYDEDLRPQVSFEVFGEQGDCLAQFLAVP